MRRRAPRPRPTIPRARRRAGTLLAAVASLALLAAACSGTSEDVVAAAGDTESGTTQQTDAPSADASEGDAMEGSEEEESPPPDGDVLPTSTFDAEAVTIDGQTYDLSQLAGTDLVLWFWAPW